MDGIAKGPIFKYISGLQVPVHFHSAKKLQG